MILERDTGPGVDAGPSEDLGGEQEFGGRLGQRLRDASDLEQAVGEVAGVGDDPGLGLLLDLAKRGEYDPWNVDIVSITDSYLEALDERLDAADLRRVARLIFYAAALIHLKAKALAERQKHLDYEEALEQAFAEEFGDAFDEHGGPISRLREGDEPLDYGFLADGNGSGFGPAERPVRERGLSLVDLIIALREYDDRLAEQEALEDDEPLFTEEQAFEECLGGSHQEDLGQDIIQTRLRLWDLLAEAEAVTLEQLTATGANRASTYLALLFLAQDEEILLEQPVFYEELQVTKGPYFGEVRAGVFDDEDDDEHEHDAWDDDDDEIAADEGEDDDEEVSETSEEPAEAVLEEGGDA